MKTNNNYIIGLVTAGMLLISCNDSFLEVESPTQDFIETYFTTDAHIQEAVVAAYDPLQWPDWGNGQYTPVNIMSDIMADDIWVGGSDKTDNQFWHFMMNYEAIPTNCMSGLWTTAYSGIKRCNDVIKYNGWGFAPVRTETYAMFDAADARRDATCWNAAAAGNYNRRYQDTGYFLEKYVALSGNNKDLIADGDLNWNNNLRIYRFSETLLNAAELILKTDGDLTEAQRYLNRVHHRAGLTDNLAANEDNVLKERRLEFVGEGKRYWDLIRTGKAAATLVPDDYGYRTNTWTESKKYLPIPQSEMDADHNLKQNDY